MNSIFKAVGAIGALFVGLTALPSAQGQVQSYSGDAYGTSITAPIVPVTITLSDTGNLPPAGGTLMNSVASANVALTGLPVGAFLTTGVENTSTSGIAQVAMSSASVNNLSLNLGGALPVFVTANSVTANSLAQVGSVSGSSIITNLNVGGVNVMVTGAPNQMLALPLGLGNLIINEQITNNFGDHYEITTNALDLTLFGGGSIVVAHANSDVTAFPGTPTPEFGSVFSLGGLLAGGGAGLWVRRKRRLA